MSSSHRVDWNGQRLTGVEIASVFVFCLYNLGMINMRIDKNYRIVNGKGLMRFFAYIHRRDRRFFGVLEAVDRQDAIDHLGHAYRLSAVWLDHFPTIYRDDKWKIVCDAFPKLKLDPSNVPCFPDKTTAP